AGCGAGADLVRGNARPFCARGRCLEVPGAAQLDTDEAHAPAGVGKSTPTCGRATLGNGCLPGPTAPQSPVPQTVHTPPGSNAMRIFHSRIAAVLVPVVPGGGVPAPGGGHAAVGAPPPSA